MANSLATIDAHFELRQGTSKQRWHYQHTLPVQLTVQRHIILGIGQTLDIIGGAAPYIEGLGPIRHLELQTQRDLNVSLFTADEYGIVIPDEEPGVYPPSTFLLKPKGLVLAHDVEIARLQVQAVGPDPVEIDLRLGGDIAQPADVVPPPSTGSLSGFIFYDEDDSSTLNGAEGGLAGVVLRIFDAALQEHFSEETTSDGLWSVSGLAPGEAVLSTQSTPPDLEVSTENVPGWPVVIAGENVVYPDIGLADEEIEG